MDQSATGVATPRVQRRRHRTGNRRRRRNAHWLIVKLERLIRATDWDGRLRPTLYRQYEQPIVASAKARHQAQQDAGTDGQSTVPDLTGLGSRLITNGFVGKVKRVRQEWPTLQPRERAKKLIAICNDALKDIGVPPMKPAIERMNARGVFRAHKWSYVLRRQTMNRWVLGDREAAELADNLMHESRHCEQYFRVARYLARKGELEWPAAQIASRLSIPENAAKTAAANPLTTENATGQEIKEARAWREAILEENRTTKNDQAGNRLNKAIAELERQRKAAMRTQSKLRKAVTTPRIDQAIEAGKQLAEQRDLVRTIYAAYRKLPHEVDAHEVGVSAAWAFDQSPSG